jgi:L-seryl-tRNA(Ser) seleniumtransferase
MITMPVDEIERRAQALVAALGAGRVIDGASTIGGGSAPGSALPTRLVAVESASPSIVAIEARLRAAPTPVIARIDDNRLLLDLRTVAPGDDHELAAHLKTALESEA